MAVKVTPMRAGLAWALFVFSFVAICFNLQRHGWPSWYRLATSGRHTVATISGKRPEDHRTCSFDYVVDSIPYQSSDQGCRFEIGRSVDVTYLPADPTFATTASPARHLLLQILAALAISIVAGTGMAGQVRKRQRRAGG